MPAIDGCDADQQACPAAEEEEEQQQSQLHDAVPHVLLKQECIWGNQRLICRMLAASGTLAAAVDSCCQGRLHVRVAPLAGSSFPGWLVRHRQLVRSISLLDDDCCSGGAPDRAFSDALARALQQAEAGPPTSGAALSAWCTCTSNALQLQSFTCSLLPAGLLQHLPRAHLTQLAFSGAEAPFGSRLIRFTALRRLQAALPELPADPAATDGVDERSALLASLSGLQALTALDLHLHVPPCELPDAPPRLSRQLVELTCTFWSGAPLQLGGFSSLTALDLDSEGHVDQGDELPPNLRRLCGVRYLKSLQPLLPLRHLRELNGITEDCAVALQACGLPQLTALRGCLACCGPGFAAEDVAKVVEVDLADHPAGCLQGPETDVEGCRDVWQRLAKLTAVTCLDVVSTAGTPNTVSALAGLQQLQKLVIRQPWRWALPPAEATPTADGSNDPMTPQLLAAVAGLPLRHLHLEGMAALGKLPALLSQIRRLTQLTALHLPGCGLADDAALCSLFPRLTRLHELDVSGNPGVGDAAVAAAADCLTLQHLNVRGTAVVAISERLLDQLTRLQL